MNELHPNEGRTLCRSWWQLVGSMYGYPWQLAAGAYQLNSRILQGLVRKAVRTPGQGPERSTTEAQRPAACHGLERQAAERVRQGLAPPKEIYGTPYRDRVDWSTFPPWARPIDPDLFQGCAHEG